MSREVVAIDIDDVVAQHAKAFCEFSNANFGTNLTVADYHEYWGEFWGVDANEVERRRTRFVSPEIMAALEPVDGASVALKAMVAGGIEVVGVTKRRESLTVVTREWLDRHCPDTFSGVIHATSFDKEGNKIVRPKDSICHEIGAKSLVDDQAEACLLVVKAGITGLVFGKESAQADWPDLMCPVKDWPAVLEHFDAQG
ncbi:MAG TPA: hypothetical protein VLG37_03075 [Candidatus Saccharimonadales bacterium]|nr:hypothetical protein [Candidatus Saccharimonadales bacterium]